MSCEHCLAAKGEGKSLVLFQDDDVVVAIRDVVLSPGQISVFPKEHFTILEMVPNAVLERCASVANKVSVACFEALGCQGTNIFTQNGIGAGQSVPHFSLEIIPRQENDGLKLDWQGAQMMEDELERTFKAISDESSDIDINKEVKQEKSESSDDEGEEAKLSEKTENYLLKSLRRLP